MAPGAKLSDLFAYCQEYCHRYVTIFISPVISKNFGRHSVPGWAAMKIYAISNDCKLVGFRRILFFQAAVDDSSIRILHTWIKRYHVLFRRLICLSRSLFAAMAN